MAFLVLDGSVMVPRVDTCNPLELTHDFISAILRLIDDIFKQVEGLIVQKLNVGDQSRFRCSSIRNPSW